jgi:hypothetical protein
LVDIRLRPSILGPRFGSARRSARRPRPRNDAHAKRYRKAPPSFPSRREGISASVGSELRAIIGATRPRSHDFDGCLYALGPGRRTSATTPR